MILVKRMRKIAVSAVEMASAAGGVRVVPWGEGGAGGKPTKPTATATLERATFVAFYAAYRAKDLPPVLAASLGSVFLYVYDSFPPTHVIDARAFRRLLLGCG